jgi:hypothetical protein
VDRVLRESKRCNEKPVDILGISRTTFYKWLKRYQKDGLKGLLDRPKTPLRKRAPTVRKKYELDIIRIRNNNPTWEQRENSNRALSSAFQS